MSLKSILPDRISFHTKLILFGNILGGFGDGINVVFQLYLISIGFGSTEIGTLLMIKTIGTALLTIPAGILANRYGKRKIMLFCFSFHSLGIILGRLTAKSLGMFCLGELLVGLGDAVWVLTTPLYSSFFDNENMDRAFGLHSFLQIIAVSMGSLLGFIPPILVSSYGLSLQESYWTMLVLSSGCFLARIPFFITSTRGEIEPERQGGFKFNLRSKDVVAKFCFINSVGIIGNGVFFNFFSFYANRKFGVESDALGTLAFVSRFVQSGANIIAARISWKLGTLKTIAVTIGLSTPFYLMIPMAPNFTWLSVIYIIRLGMISLSSPLRSSLFMKLLYDEEKATASSITSMASQGSNIVAPWLGGQLMEQVSLDFPVYLGAGLFAIYAASHYLLRRNEKEKTI